MIRVDVRAKSFGKSQVLGRIAFTLDQGETVAIVGPSGIGKSTLLRLVMGVDTHFDGHIERPDKVAVVFQEPTLLPWRRVIENITLVHPDLPREKVVEMLGRVGLAEKSDQFPNQLSLGQQRRLALARAFAGTPELLIMDEPFVSLDPATAEDMLSLTESLIADVRPATIFVTHSAAEAARLATRTLRLEGSPATLREEAP